MHRSFLFFIFLILLILGLMHFVTYKVVTSLFEINSLENSLLQLSVVLSLSFITSSYFVRNLNNIFTRAYYRISSVWMGYLFYLFLASGLYGIVLGVNELTSSMSSVTYIGKTFLFLGILIPTYALWKAHHLGNNRKNCFSEKFT